MPSASPDSRLSSSRRCRLGVQLFERRLGLGDDRRVALGLAELDQLERFVDLALDPPVAVDRLVEPGALAQQLLRRGRIVPQLRVLGLARSARRGAGLRLPSQRCLLSSANDFLMSSATAWISARMAHSVAVSLDILI